MGGRLQFCFALAIALHAGASGAHTMWINLVPSYEDRQVVVSIAYGDELPGNELLSTDWGQMRVARYEAIAPDGQRTALAPPTPVHHEKRSLPSGLNVQQGGDAGIHRLQYPAGSVRGTYQVAAQSDLFRYIHYRDQQGAEHYTDLPLEKLTGVDEVLDTSLDLYFMKSVFAVGGWTDAAPVGQYLEIVPLSDLSNVRPGDVVRFKVLLGGQSWSPESGSPQITAHSPSFGNRWGLVSSLKFGEGELRLPSAGTWRIATRVHGKAGEHAPVAGKARADEPIYIESTFVLIVRP